jgi:acrylyl-CoA reductase (NADPH)
MSYRALVVDRTDDRYDVEVRDLDEANLPPGDVTIRVEWSSVNYKDGLALTPAGRILRSFPMVPGIDLAGEVVASTAGAFAPGQRVLVTGYDLGVAHPGGFAELARVPAGWVVPLPAGLTTREAMAIGTAGLTAALSVESLERNGLRPENGTVLVTGATGGVGSTAVSMLAQLGYTVAASTGKESEHQFLRNLGVTEILSRSDVSAESSRPIEAERWAGAVDPVGGATTAYLLRTMRYGGSIALSGLTGGTAVNTAVFPFILRGVNLLGIDSVMCPMERRLRIWNRLGADLKPHGLMESIAIETGLGGVEGVAAAIRDGRVRGRTLVRLSPS